MGNQASNEEDDKKKGATIVENTSGFHVLEFHMPTVGSSLLITFFLMSIAVGLILVFTRLRRRFSKKAREQLQQHQLLSSVGVPMPPPMLSGTNSGSLAAILPFLQQMNQLQKPQPFQPRASPSRFEELHDVELQPYRPQTIREAPAPAPRVVRQVPVQVQVHREDYYERDRDPRNHQECA